MARIEDRDRNFTGEQRSSTPKNLLSEGQISRLINGRFVEGAISNAISFDRLDFTFSEGNDKKIFTSNVTYYELLKRGDVQLVAPLDNFNGQFLITVISGILFLLDLQSKIFYDITPKDAFLPNSSSEGHLSYLDNDGGVSGIGGYAVIFNYPNLPIFVNHEGARLSNRFNMEMPVARLGVSAGNRVFIVSGDNVMWASDPLGGAESLAPLTFTETLTPSSPFYAQLFTIGNPLDAQYVTNMSRLPKFLGPSQDFLAQNLLISTRINKYIIAAGAPRDTWDDIQFITYAGSLEGIAGPLASTVIGENLFYISKSGRIKFLGQDQIRETGLTENFVDDPLGQFLCCWESNYYYRDWYATLDHSRSLIKFSNDRLFATVYPVTVPAIDRYGKIINSVSHRALAVGSMASETLIGGQVNLAWEGFYDWINPIGLVTIKKDLYVVSKNLYGTNEFYKMNLKFQDNHNTTIITRGYFSNVNSKAKSFLTGELYFRKLSGPMEINVSYLYNNIWKCLDDGLITKEVYKFTARDNNYQTDAYSIPLKLEIKHKGCSFELETVRVDGEPHRKD